MMFSWLPCTNWVMRLVWSTPMTPQPSWLLSTSGWTPRTSSFPTTIAEAYSNSMVRHQEFLIKSMSKKSLLFFSLGGTLEKMIHLKGRRLDTIIHESSRTCVLSPLNLVYFGIIFVCVIFGCLVSLSRRLLL